MPPRDTVWHTEIHGHIFKLWELGEHNAFTHGLGGTVVTSRSLKLFPHSQPLFTAIAGLSHSELHRSVSPFHRPETWRTAFTSWRMNLFPVSSPSPWTTAEDATH